MEEVPLHKTSGSGMVFRQLTGNEKAKVLQARELYEKFLGDDIRTKDLLDRIYGHDMWKALETPEKRALWRVGHEMDWSGMISYSRDSNTQWDFAAKPGQAVTDNDPYYMTLGASTPRQEWEE